MKRADYSALVHIAEGECPLPCEPAVASRVLATVDALSAEVKRKDAALRVMRRAVGLEMVLGLEALRDLLRPPKRKGESAFSTPKAGWKRKGER